MPPASKDDSLELFCYGRYTGTSFVHGLKHRHLLHHVPDARLSHSYHCDTDHFAFNCILTHSVPHVLKKHGCVEYLAQIQVEGAIHLIS